MSKGETTNYEIAEQKLVEQIKVKKDIVNNRLEVIKKMVKDIRCR